MNRNLVSALLCCCQALALTLALALALALALTTAAYAAEIDSITARKVQLDDALSRLNEIFNARLADGVEKANAQDRSLMGSLSKTPYCNESTLYGELRKAVFQSYTASWGLKGYDLDVQMREALSTYSYSLSLNDSIYRDLDYLEAFSLNLKELSDLVNIHGHLIGLDKIGHFFAQGWQYFELAADEGNNLETAINWGKTQEEGKYGYATTGIYSFADLTANLDGWIFWNRILLKESDPLKNIISNFFNSAYVSCNLEIIESIKQGTIVRAWNYRASFDFSDYIDGAWDEANNCNSYKNPLIEEKVRLRIKHVSPEYSCPLIKESCIEAREKYGPFAKHVLHPHCLTAD